MTTINRSALLPYDAHQLFALVCDIEAYPEFMDGCVGAQILSQEQNIVVAKLDLAKGGVRQSFSTRNLLEEPSRILLELVDGPFDSFSGCWHFRVLGDSACKISLDLEFTINNAVLGAAASRIFERVTNSLVDAISDRAKQVYA